MDYNSRLPIDSLISHLNINDSSSNINNDDDVYDHQKEDIIKTPLKNHKIPKCPNTPKKQRQQHSANDIHHKMKPRVLFLDDAELSNYNSNDSPISKFKSINIPSNNSSNIRSTSSKSKSNFVDNSNNKINNSSSNIHSNNSVISSQTPMSIINQSISQPVISQPKSNPSLFVNISTPKSPNTVSSSPSSPNLNLSLSLRV